MLPVATDPDGGNNVEKMTTPHEAFYGEKQREMAAMQKLAGRGLELELQSKQRAAAAES